MTQSSELLQLINENATSIDERRDLEQVVRVLGRLEGRVPHRPEFRTQLRERLKQEARRMRPWYRRPALWTAGGALAASVAALAVLNLWDQPPTPTQPPAFTAQSPPPAAEAPSPAPSVPPTVEWPTEQGRPSHQLVQDLQVPRVPLPDEWAGAAPQPTASANTVTITVREGLVAPAAPAKLRVYAVAEIPPKSDALANWARRMGFKSEATGTTGQSLTVTEADRSLLLETSGKLLYEGPAEGLALPAPDSAGAERAAMLWMQAAGIAVPSGEREVVKEMDLWRVSFRSVISSGLRAPTEDVSVWVAETGHIVRAETMTGRLEDLGEVGALSFDDAVAQMQTLRLQGVEGHADLTVQAAELIYARVSAGRPGSSVYLQPYWRLTASVGEATVHRYIPAIASQHLQ